MMAPRAVYGILLGEQRPTMRQPVYLIAAAVVLMASANAATCYTLLAPNGSVARQSTQSPVDMSRSISDEVARRFPGHHLVFGPANSCQEIGPEHVERTVAVGGVSSSSRSQASTELFSGYQASVMGGDELMSSGAPSAGGSAIGGSFSGGSYASSGSRSPGTDVRVRGQTRRDGTYVRPHTRSAPRR